MTKAKAQTVVSALIGQGYQVQTVQDPADPLNLRVFATGSAINPQVVADFATAQGITASVTEARFE